MEVLLQHMCLAKGGEEDKSKVVVVNCIVHYKKREGQTTTSYLKFKEVFSHYKNVTWTSAMDFMI